MPDGGRRAGRCGSSGSRCTRSSASPAAIFSGLGLARVPRDRRGLRDRAARGPARVRQAAGADLHPGDQGRGRRARREHRLRARGRDDRRPGADGGAAPGRRSSSTSTPATTPRERGIIIADTKFEFGSSPGAEVVLGDEVLTPGLVAVLARRRLRARPRARPRSTSSTCATGSTSRAGITPRPGPELPDEVVANTRAKYVEAYERITGRTLGESLPLVLSAMNLFDPAGCAARARRSSTTRCARTPGCAASTSRCARTPRRSAAAAARATSTSSPRPESCASASAPSTTRSCRSSSSTGAARARRSSSSSPGSPTTSAGCSPTCSARRPTWRSRRPACTTSSARSPRSTPRRSVVHLVRDPRAVTASMLLGRRRRTDIYPDADTFFTARTGRRLWSSRRISEEVVARRRSLEPPGRPARLHAPADRLEGGLRDHRGRRRAGCSASASRPCGSRTCAPTHARELERIYSLLGRPAAAGGRGLGDRATSAATTRSISSDDPRWARAARLLGMEERARARRLRRDPRARAGARRAARPDPAGARLAARRVHGPRPPPPGLTLDWKR